MQKVDEILEGLLFERFCKAMCCIPLGINPEKVDLRLVYRVFNEKPPQIHPEIGILRSLLQHKGQEELVDILEGVSSHEFQASFDMYRLVALELWVLLMADLTSTRRWLAAPI